MHELHALTSSHSICAAGSTGDVTPHPVAWLDVSCLLPGSPLAAPPAAVSGQAGSAAPVWSACRPTDRNLCMQVRAGTGGDEAALWVSELVRMYQRYADQQQWKVSFISATEGEKGGYRECIVQVTSRCLRPQLGQCTCSPALRLSCSQEFTA